jgi:hypothetical protein
MFGHLKNATAAQFNILYLNSYTVVLKNQHNMECFCLD